MNLCKNGLYYNNGVEEKLTCKINNDICAYIRYCVNDRCIKMLPSYINCKNINDNEVV